MRYRRIDDRRKTSRDDLPDIDARLLIISGPDAKSTDARYPGIARERRSEMRFPYNGTSLPIYGPVLTFGHGRAAVLFTHADVSTKRLPVVRLGYDLFDEVRFLLSAGQPVRETSAVIAARHEPMRASSL